ncbi:MAG: response regulator [Thiotrichales bacterium]
MSDSVEQTAPSQQRVLVVDDSRVIRKAVTTILSDDYEILEAQSGNEALSILDSDADIHLILLDLWMPDVDGFEVLEAVRNSDSPAINGLPVIIVTGHEDDVEIRGRAESLGASDFIGKPFSAVELRHNVAHYILPVSKTNVVPFRGSGEDATPEPDTEKPRVRSADEIRKERESYLNVEGQKQLMQAAQTRQPMTVVRFQVDRVKALLHKTDTEFTKRSLYRVYKLIEQETRQKDILVRVGPTDFALIMPKTENAEAKEVCKSIYRILRYSKFTYGDMKFRLTISAGMVTPRIDESTRFETVVALADVRLERAYNSGGDQLIHEDLTGDAVRSARAVSLDDACAALNGGDPAVVKQQLPRLLRRITPLLSLANTTLGLNIDDALQRIHAYLRG